MNNFIEDVKAFHLKFGFTLPSKPTQLPNGLFLLKAEHLAEEVEEFLNAKNDMAGQLDAIVDIIYVAIGAALLAGYPLEEAWNEVHRANMSKIRTNRAGDSTRNSSFDVIKPKNFTPPDIEKIIEDALHMEVDNK